MTHTHHLLDDHDPEAILWDGCDECEKRAKLGIEGLLYLDETNLHLLWQRCLNTEYRGRGEESGGKYRSHAERDLGHTLYLIAVLDERTKTWASAWSQEKYAAKPRAAA